MRVIVTGRLKTRSFQTKQGDNRTVFEIDVDEVGPSLRYATAQVTRTPREGGGQQAQQSGQWSQQPPAQQQPAQGNTWGTTPQDNPPF